MKLKSLNDLCNEAWSIFMTTSTDAGFLLSVGQIGGNANVAS